MNIDEMAPSKSEFLAKEDVGENGKNLTIKGFANKEVKSDEGVEHKWVIQWHEDMKPLILNKTNVNRLKVILKTSDTEMMLNQVVNVFNDPFVEYAGKTVGGVRIRPAGEQAPSNAYGQGQTPPPESYQDEYNQ